MKTIFNDVLDNQKKVFDMWSDLSSKVIESTTTNGAKTFATKNQTFVQDWFNKNSAIVKDAFKTNDAAKAIEVAPQTFQKMIESQIEFFENWKNAYTEQIKSFSAEIPGFDKKAFEKSIEAATAEWNKWMDNSTKWMEENVVKHIPAPVKPAFESFQKSYATIQKMWEPITNMIKNGVNQTEFVNSFIPADFYKNLVNQMMGYKLTNTPSELLEQTNKMFDNWIKQVQTTQPSYDKFINWMNETNKNWDVKAMNPVFGFMTEMTQQMKNHIEPLFNVMENNDQTETVKIIKDIQFMMSSYIVKSFEMQAKMYENTRHALPEIMKTFTAKFNETKQMPDTMEFFKQYMDVLEKYMLEVLNTKEYSTLQAETSKISVQIKSKFDEIAEKALAQVPVLTKSIGNELSKEIADLKRKIRVLEQSLAKTAEPVVTKATTATTTPTTTPTTTVSTASVKTKASKN